MFNLNILGADDSGFLKIQRQGIAFLKHFICLHVVFVAGAAWLAGNDVVALATASILLSAVNYFIVSLNNIPLSGNTSAVSLMGQVFLVVAALKGHPYQIDVHMYFFATLGILASLLSITAIGLATVTVATHHLVLYLLIPIYVFPGESTFVRIILHVVILLCEAGVILWVLKMLIDAFATSLEDAKQKTKLIEQAEAQRSEERQKAAKEREMFIAKLSAEFKHSVSRVIGDVFAKVETSLARCDQIMQQAQKSKERSDVAAQSVAKTLESSSSVAAATEELNTSIEHISSQTLQASSNAAEAAKDASSSTAVVERLAKATEEISTIISVINRITGQINLLALNATIESARAGDAGKGFAVVAGEVKTLAQQTEVATKQISQSIASMHEVSKAVSDSIGGIVSAVTDITTISQNIAAAVQQQSSASREISMRTQEVSSSAALINKNVGDLDTSIDETSGYTQELQALFVELQATVTTLNNDAEHFVSTLQTA